ncbi:MAG: oligosaccharide flippase family protein, partial [Anaerolineae bacterium]|nr:oligosaccharide flippase family protein [Anaerolineae bacterium]
MDINAGVSSAGNITTPADTAEGFSSGAAKRAARNATALALSNIASKGLMFVWQLILARWLGSGDYGVYGTVGALLAVGAAIPEFGMGLMVIRDVAPRRQDAGRYLAATLTMQPLFAVAGYGVLMLAALLLGYDAKIRTLLAFAAVNLLVDALGNMCHNQLLAIERMVIPAIIATGHILVLTMLAGIALALDAGLWGLYAATLIAGLLRTAVYWVVLLCTGTRPEFPLDRVVARSLLINGAPLALTSFLALAYTHTDKLITTAVLGTEGTGQLTAGFVIVFGVIELLSTT